MKMFFAQMECDISSELMTSGQAYQVKANPSKVEEDLLFDHPIVKLTFSLKKGGEKTKTMKKTLSLCTHLRQK